MITAFLPCRKGSQRIPNKNIKKFADVEGGLLEIKIKQLLAAKCVDRIVVSSNDERVLDFCNTRFGAYLILDERPDHLGRSETSTDELINYVPSIISEGVVLWTHVTSPFIEAADYDNIINQYIDAVKQGYDSLMTVKKIMGFLWRNGRPLTYSRDQEKWPRTQTIEPVFEVDSGAFVADIAVYRDFGDRIGERPYLLEQNHVKTLDIDWPDDFELAELLWKRADRN
ncbi:acylneuraminate cytidylyltransferase family protein [Microbulbifer thermotolerans]|uniref:acylneuraminate cytidylyltransferase family protein n=1 Tax=Microbulbifer thermotolerans TaxID=252514 RepID=UPI0022488761|nr:acylneuraminate cytidylyltransferase family protein [Microbulbifer thermotolerans]MCX2831891.1 acylneuraminate cytidylyltransferase family protein [Microbulbifer thermotolerans]